MNQPALILSKTKLIEISKGRKVSVIGFRTKGAIEHLEDHLVDVEAPWCDVGCMASVMFGRNTEGNRAKIRRSVRQIFRELLSRRRFLAISYDAKSHGRIAAIKIYEGSLVKEKQSAVKQLKRMIKHKQITDDLLESARVLLGLDPESLNEEEDVQDNAAQG